VAFHVISNENSLSTRPVGRKFFADPVSRIPARQTGRPAFQQHSAAHRLRAEFGAAAVAVEQVDGTSATIRIKYQPSAPIPNCRWQMARASFASPSDEPALFFNSAVAKLRFGQGAAPAGCGDPTGRKSLPTACAL
jgi:hypothetical protein